MSMFDKDWKYKDRLKLARLVKYYSHGQEAVMLSRLQVKLIREAMTKVWAGADFYAYGYWWIGDVFGYNSMDIEVIPLEEGTGMLRIISLRRHEIGPEYFNRVRISSGDAEAESCLNIQSDDNQKEYCEKSRPNTREMLRKFLASNYGQHFAILTETETAELLESVISDYINCCEYKYDPDLRSDKFYVYIPDEMSSLNFRKLYENKEPWSFKFNNCAPRPSNYTWKAVDVELYMIPGTRSWLLYTSCCARVRSTDEPLNRFLMEIS